MHWLKRHVGELVIGTDVFHSVCSVATQRRIVAGIWRDGLVNSVDDDDHERFGWFWFATTGFTFLSSGVLTRSHIRQTGSLLVSFGAILLAAWLFNIALQPRTGTWLVAAEAASALAVAANGAR
jgi:hypothetical protein